MHSPIQGILHTYCTSPILTAFLHSPASSSSSSDPSTSLILYVGGLFDGLRTVPYVPRLNSLDVGKWSVAEVLLSSSYTAYGTSSVQRDAEELGKAVTYFRGLGWKRIVLFGHSTGTQDLIAYTHLNPTSPPVEAYILQAPVSDREHIERTTPDYKLTPEEASAPAVPIRLSGPAALVTPKRWQSLTLPPASDQVDLAECEDFFSTDLSDERLKNVFGKVDKPMLLLFSGEDFAYAPGLDKEKLLERFQSCLREEVRSKESGIVAGASHNVAEDKAQEAMLVRVVAFLQALP